MIELIEFLIPEEELTTIEEVKLSKVPVLIIWGNDWLGRPIGFFGTIAFTGLIEKRGVKILDTITVWIDWITGAKPNTAKAD